MTRWPLVLVLALAGCSAPERERVADVGQAFYCRLYPSKCQKPETPAIEQPAPPVEIAPEPAPEPKPVLKTPVAPPVKVERKAEPARPRAKFKPVERKPRPAAKRNSEVGPNLPYPCWLVRMHASGKSEADLRAMGRANGITLSAKQERQARKCLKGTTK